MKLYVKTSYILIVLLLFVEDFALTQSLQQKFVLDKDAQTTIPFVNIFVKDGAKGWVTDLNGVFRYEQEHLKPSDLLVFSAIGYKKFELPYFAIKDCTLIYLQPKTFTLNEVKIKARSYKRGRLGERKKNTMDLSHFGIRSDHVGLKEEACFIPNNKCYNGILDEIVLFVKKGSETPFEINIYNVNLATGTPNQKINDSPIFAKASENLIWLKIPIRNQNLTIPKEGYFISINWDVDSIYWEQSDTIVNDNSIYVSRGVILGDVFLKNKNRWIRNENGITWRRCYTEELALNQSNTYSEYQNIATYSNVLYDKEAVNELKQILKSKQILSSRKQKKALKKHANFEKTDIVSFPQDSPKDLLLSIMKTEKQNRFRYALHHLYYFKENQLDSLIQNSSIPKFSPFDPTNLSYLNEISVEHLESNFYSLTYKDETYNLMYKEGKWYFSPY